MAKIIKTVNLDEVQEAPMYINHMGHVYERIDGDTEKLDLDLTDESLKCLDFLFSQGMYVNRNEIIRESLRNYIKENQKILPDKKSKTTKKKNKK